MTNGFTSYAYRRGYIDGAVGNLANPTYSKGRCKFYGLERIDYFVGYNDASSRDSKAVAKAKAEEYALRDI
ncbi:MAG: hypothetical protein K6T65_05570 [Peptococcaceae bacterium]|nr:hypothetical protein [Peptococcaceae bacterium]